MTALRRVAALAAALVSVPGCAGSEKAPEVHATARVIVETAAGAKLPVRVELARTDAEREKGLMDRRSLDPDAGMLFVFDVAAVHAFWMKNTLIPLDMIFIDDDGRIVGIVERAEPLTLTPRDVGKPSRYVLEVNGGWSAAHGVRAGDRVRFEGVLF